MRKSSIICILVLSVSLSVFFACSQKGEDEQLLRDMRYRSSAMAMEKWLTAFRRAKYDAIHSFVSGLSVEEKLSQLFLINLEGKEDFVPVEYDNDGLPCIPGGFLFFSYNVADTAADAISFTTDILNTSIESNRIPPLLVIDHEGGDVNRLRQTVSPIPSPLAVSQSMTPSQAEQFYENQGEQLHLLGFHLNLAPVAEPILVENKTFLGSRSYGSNDSVLRYASASIQGYKKAGVGNALKHFPGNTNVDPHTGLPEINVSQESLERDYLSPFRDLIQYEPMAVLMSHARINNSFDSQTPACLSSFWIDTVLRDTLGYDGLIISDDILMSALAQNGFPPDKAVLMALKAGIDIIMISEKRYMRFVPLIRQQISTDPVFAAAIDRAVERIIRTKIDCGLLMLQTVDSIPSSEGVPIPVFKVNLPSYISQSDCVARVSSFTESKKAGLELYTSFMGVDDE